MYDMNISIIVLTSDSYLLGFHKLPGRFLIQLMKLIAHHFDKTILGYEMTPLQR